jgi:hypothetical protein
MSAMTGSRPELAVPTHYVLAPQGVNGLHAALALQGRVGPRLQF